ncbi:hypothetical protein BUZ02_03220 [Staphylococcus gallinarum]|nr:hypothetical protein BUZ03_07835 [Staphylococcus gallinarum]RIL20924.1 hypothetical protein BUY99_09765 [Staphylococcus gallinarum]RIL30730.1 hypothetical protein BUY95_01395 [Staphylococcus gallinarum]RIO86236.1 hypothetical protein BUZ10_02960 [Staphylococcus gallinarum]RIP07455.1 hypothetical protein BUZ02_03220 [Staphylococcus gallinarum]
MACQPKIECVFRVGIFLFFCFLDCFAPFPRGQLQPVVFSLSCSLRSLANNLAYITNNYSVVYTFIMICIFLFYKKGDFYYYCNRNHLNLLVRVLNL